MGPTPHCEIVNLDFGRLVVLRNRNRADLPAQQDSPRKFARDIRHISMGKQSLISVVESLFVSSAEEA